MQRVDDFFHLELDNWMAVVSVGVVFHKECSGFFVTVGSNKPSCSKRQLLTFPPYEIIISVLRKHTWTLWYEPDKQTHNTGTKHLQPQRQPPAEIRP